MGSACVSVARAIRDFLTIDFGEYTHFSPDGFVAGVTVTAGFLLFVAVVIFFSYRASLWEDFLRGLTESGASDADSAKTLSELGLERSILLRRALGTDSPLAKCVRCAEEERYLAAPDPVPGEGEPAPKPPFRHTVRTEHFYLPEEARPRAEVRFLEHRTSPVGVAVLLAALTAAYFLLMGCLPALAGLLDWFLGKF